MRQNLTNPSEMLPGSRYALAVQTAVDGVLAPMGISRRVISQGARFLNRDAWTGELFVEFMCEWLSQNPTKVPAKSDVVKIIEKANRANCRDPYIQVARIPMLISVRLALGIVGGGYHEAWHTKYSKRSKVQLDEVWHITQMFGEVIHNGGSWDAKMRGLLMSLHHLVEDIRIERRGNEDFPGAIQPMRDLQDFILDQEEKSRLEGQKEANVTSAANNRSVVLSVFRDLGLGYNTSRARQAIEWYKEQAPQAVAMVAPGGIWAPMLYEAKNLSASDLMGSFRVATKMVVALWKAMQQEQEDQPDLECPNCGAGPKDIIIRAVYNEDGVKVRGRAQMECKVCGFKHEFDLPDNSLNLNRDSAEEPEERPEVEDLTQDDIDGMDGFGDDLREHARDFLRDLKDQIENQGSGGQSGEDSQEGSSPLQTQGKPQSGGTDDEDSEGGESEGEGDQEENKKGTSSKKAQDQDDAEESEGSSASSSHKDDEGEKEDEEGQGTSDEQGREEEEEEAGSSADDNQEGEGEDTEGDIQGKNRSDKEEQGKTSEGETDEGEGESAGKPDWDNRVPPGKESKGKPQQQTEQNGFGAGGHVDLGLRPDEAAFIAECVLDGNSDQDPLNNQSALEEAVEEAMDQEMKQLQPGEMAWNPFAPWMDEAHLIRSHNLAFDQRRGNELTGSVRQEVASLRARLRNIVRAMEMTDITHGVRRGNNLSDRFLVDSALELRDGTSPSRPYVVQDDTVETSIASALCLDQSSSTYGIRELLTKLMIVICEPHEGIGGKTMAFGFRDGQYHNTDLPSNWHRVYHRAHGVRIDVFKMWEETFTSVKWRFAHTTSDGGTPMADGLQFGLEALQTRSEAHRILWVITDGMPNSPHERVMRTQIRKAKQAGIHVIGVGVGHNAHYVQHVFPDSVYSPHLAEIPDLIMKKLNEVCDFTGRFRGRKIQNFDNRMVKRITR